MRSGLTEPSTYVLAGVALIPALILAGLMQVLVPQDVVARYFGRTSGIKAIGLASLAFPILAGWLVALFSPE